jgi:hypothetical protein
VFGGEEFPLNPPFLERPLVEIPTNGNGNGTNLYSIKAGSFFMRGEEVHPGASLILDFPLISGKPPELVGISYYTGSFNDGNDFIGNLGVPLANTGASLRDKAEFFWERFKRRLRGPQYHEVWCSQSLSFQKAPLH